MGKRKHSQVDVIEATYAAADTEGDWLREIAAAAAPLLDEGLGVTMATYAGSGRVRCEAVQGIGLEVPLEIFPESIESMPADFVDRVGRTLSFTLCSEYEPLGRAPWTHVLRDAGIRDIVSITAYDPSGFGVWLAAPLRAERTRRPREGETWTRVASHLGSALRLRRRGAVRPSPDAATTVLDTKGRIEHATDGKSADRLRGVLRDAVVHMERARGPMRRSDPAGAVEAWKPLVDAELTLLDYFERGGKRYVVAVENPPAKVESLSMLSPREQQVVAMAAAGRTNKLIAYELGIAHSTVRVLLTRSAQRLGVASRRELVAIHKAHQRAARR